MVKGFFRHVKARDIAPIISGILAAESLTKGIETPTSKKAVAKIEQRAKDNFVASQLSEGDVQRLRKLYEKTAYWHGTGRYQWEGEAKVDILQQILERGSLQPHLDKYDPRLGDVAVSTVSLARDRLYARCYADMHHERPAQLNRFIDASHAVSYFVVRPYIRHRYLQAKSHPKGLIAGRRAQVRADAARFKQVGRHWTDKITKQHVNPMLAFRAGSDIPGNYGIVIGLDDHVVLSAAHKAFSETREVRSDDPITLEHVTHIEVPTERCEEVNHLLVAHGYVIPVISLESMESCAASLPIEKVLGLV